MTPRPIETQLFHRLNQLGVRPDDLTAGQLERMLDEGAVLYVKRIQEFPGAPLILRESSMFEIKPGQKLPKVSK